LILRVALAAVFMMQAVVGADVVLFVLFDRDFSQPPVAVIKT
jgi:hypothetical protein